MGGTGSDRPLKLALLGRSNVGKSSLFNRLEGRGRALTAPSPHLTRDCRLGTWTHAALPGAVELVDTPGWQERPADELLRALSAASERAAADADIVALVCDVRVGLLPDDMACAQRLHRLGKPLMLVLNKSDGRARAPAADWARLGLGAPVEVSALHGSGLE
ncbi:MAG: 50S ribosome-binding GTPase, partial [Hyphomicrobiales bacterium]|nr:50S ribosome-binding GTPase [Hyphomicrobiales bacterium]